MDFFALQLNMSKAYDRLEWKFLEEIMKRMGFCDKWISRIMNCFKTVIYSFNVNGEIKGHVTPNERNQTRRSLISLYVVIILRRFHQLAQESRKGKKDHRDEDLQARTNNHSLIFLLMTPLSLAKQIPRKQKSLWRF